MGKPKKVTISKLEKTRNEVKKLYSKLTKIRMAKETMDKSWDRLFGKWYKKKEKLKEMVNNYYFEGAM